MARAGCKLSIKENMTKKQLKRREKGIRGRVTGDKTERSLF
jgi:hypothetical protein